MTNVIRLYTCLTLLSLLCVMPACKKDNSANGIDVSGTWRDLTTSSNELSYYHFTDERKMYHLYTTVDDYKNADYSIYKFTGNQIQINSSANFSSTNILLNVRQDGDTLFFDNATKHVFVLLKEKHAPTSISDWVKPIVIADRFTDTLHAATITHYAGKLYTFKYYSSGSKLVEYNTLQHRISALTPADMAYQGLDYVDNTLWCVHGQYAYKFNTGLGAFTFKSAVISPSNYLWATAGGDGKLYNYASGNYIDYNILDDSWENVDDINNDVTDMAFANGYLYVAKGGLIYNMHPYYKRPVQSWYLDGYTVNGIAYDGTYFWLTTKNKQTAEYEVLKVTLN